ncbi:MAG TPA: gas vesicle protein [Blastocatellia bacterium]|nr:gas vesicle protein [Blastocatellia bacterium]
MSTDRTSLIAARPPGLVDVLDRILDKGLVIAGDIKISLANVELLTLQIRLLVCSIDKAEQIGLNWWRFDPNLTGSLERAATEDVELHRRIEHLEREVRRIGATSARASPASRQRVNDATKRGRARPRRRTEET